VAAPRVGLSTFTGYAAWFLGDGSLDDAPLEPSHFLDFKCRLLEVSERVAGEVIVLESEEQRLE
jgi:hypothetical protein